VSNPVTDISGSVRKATPNTTIVLSIMGVVAVVGAYFLLKDVFKLLPDAAKATGEAAKKAASTVAGAAKAALDASRIAETPEIVKQAAYDAAEKAGYDAAVAANAPQLEYARQRSAFCRARGIIIDQAAAYGWPDFTTWKRTVYNP